MRKLLKIFIILLAITLGVFGWLFFQIITTGQSDQTEHGDAIVVLGAAEYGGKPSPVFQARLDHAKELYEKGVAPLIITTGGTYPGEKKSEGEVGKKYLEKKAVPASSIIAETESLTTKQNLMRVRDLIKEKNIQRIILVSDPFHMYRAMILAKDLGLTPLASPTRTSPISQNAWLQFTYTGREAILILAHVLFDL